MFKSKWGACAFGILMMVSFMATGSAIAQNSCGDNVEARLSKVERDIAHIKALLGQNPAPVNPPAQTPVACGSINLRTAQLHVKCTTSKGAVYERVSRDNFGEAWKGPDGVIWSDLVGQGSQDSVANTCKNLGGTLPERADFERGEANGFREVLPNMKDQWFWSSSVNPSASVFFGNNGVIYDGSRNGYYSVLCVGR